jgi:hypothetical protein
MPLADARVRIVTIIAFGAINWKHEKIQDIDLGVQIDPRGEGPISKADQNTAFKELRGRSTALKLPFARWFDKHAGTNCVGR